MNNESPILLRRELEPYLEMLEEKYKSLPRESWDEMVNSTVERITSVPEQYLTGNLKPSPELQQVIERIFKERLN